MEMLTGSQPITSESLGELPLMPKRNPNEPVSALRKHRQMAVFDVYQTVIKSHLPRLPSKTFSHLLENFVTSW